VTWNAEAGSDSGLGCCTFEKILYILIVIVIQPAHGCVAVCLAYGGTRRCREFRLRNRCRPRASAWCGNAEVSATMRPVKRPESDRWKESGEVTSPHDVGNSPAGVVGCFDWIGNPVWSRLIANRIRKSPPPKNFPSCTKPHIVLKAA